MADVNPAVEQVVEQLQEVAKELDEIKTETAPAAPAAEIPAAPETPKAPEAPAPAESPVPTADIQARLADPAAPEDFEDRSDSVGNIFRVWKDGRVELRPNPNTVR